MNTPKILIQILFLCSISSCSGLKTFFVGKTFNRTENFKFTSEKGIEEHFANLAINYVNTPGIKLKKVSKNSQQYLKSLYQHIVRSNEIVLSKKLDPKFYVIKDDRPFYFALPRGYFVFSSGLFDRYLKNEEIFISILAFQIFRVHKNIFYNQTVVPLGFLSTERLISLTRLSVKERVEVAKWSFLLMKRSGYDGLAYLQWLQIQNKYTLDFSVMTGNARNLIREEFLFKNFIVSEGSISRDYDVDERNSSKNFYRLQKEIRRRSATRAI